MSFLSVLKVTVNKYSIHLLLKFLITYNMYILRRFLKFVSHVEMSVGDVVAMALCFVNE